MATEDKGSGPGVNTGGTVNPIYSVRDMKCLVVSESELKQIGLANLGVTVFAAIGSALISFSVDIYKDTALSAPTVPGAAAVANMVDRLAFWAGIISWAIGGAVWLWRRDMIKTIRSESQGTSSAADQ